MRRWLLLLGLGLAACEGSCGSEQLLATLTALTGSEVERDEAEEVGRWRRAQLSDGFYMGDGLRTGPDGHARLGLVPDGTARLARREEYATSDASEPSGAHVIPIEGYPHHESPPPARPTWQRMPRAK